MHVVRSAALALVFASTALLTGAAAQSSPETATQTATQTANQTAPGPSQVHCSLQPGPAASPALAAFTAGDFATAESLYAAQTSASPATAYPGLVRAQLESNELPAALISANAAVTASLLTALSDDTDPIRGTVGTIVKVVAKDGGGESDYHRTDVFTPQGALLHVKSPQKLPVYRFTLNEVPDPRSISFDLAPMSHDIGVEVSGLLGFSILRAYITDINYRDALVRIQFDQNRRYLVRESEGHY